MPMWQVYREQAPSGGVLREWLSWPAAGAGIMLGSPAGEGHVTVCLDLDIRDPDALDALLRQLPATPMARVGSKGRGMFFRALAGLLSNVSYKAGGAQLLDVLTAGRQALIPPTIHPMGMAYRWIGAAVAPDQLPVFGADDLARMEEQLECLGWRRGGEVKPKPPPREADEGETLWQEVNRRALDALDSWVGELDLYGLQRARSGYEAVATWRASSTGRGADKRKRNLSIQPNGITDFGDGPKGYSAIDLVMAARDVSRLAAVDWLQERLGIAEAPAVLVARPKEAPPVEVAQRAVQSQPGGEHQGDEVRGPTSLVRVSRQSPLRAPGLIGAMADWILASARRPLPEAALGAALAVMSVAMGRRWCGPTDSGPQLYVLVTAPTGAGKEHPIQCAKRLLTAAGHGADRHNGALGPDEYTSQWAVIGRLVKAPVTLSAMDEFGAFLGRICHPRASTMERGITKTLRTAWGCPPTGIITGPERANSTATPIYSPCLSVLGLSTAEEFYAALTGADVLNGLLNRFLLLEARARRPEREPTADAAEPPEAIVTALRALLEHGDAWANSQRFGSAEALRPIRIMWAGGEPQAAYKALVREIEARQDATPAVANFYARSAEMAVRLAAMAAMARAVEVGAADGAAVSVEDMAWGCEMALTSAEQMIAAAADYLADNANQAMAQAIKRATKAAAGADGWAAHSEVLMALKHTIRARDFKELIETMSESGDVEIRREPKPQGGAPAKYYRC
jgi:hypothetical protein